MVNQDEHKRQSNCKSHGLYLLSTYCNVNHSCKQPLDHLSVVSVALVCFLPNTCYLLTQVQKYPDIF